MLEDLDEGEGSEIKIKILVYNKIFAKSIKLLISENRFPLLVKV